MSHQAHFTPKARWRYPRHAAFLHKNQPDNPILESQVLRGLRRLSGEVDAAVLLSGRLKRDQ